MSLSIPRLLGFLMGAYGMGKGVSFFLGVPRNSTKIWISRGPEVLSAQ